MVFKSGGEVSIGIQILEIINPESCISVNLFDRKNCMEWSYSARMTVGGTKRLGYIDSWVVEQPMNDPKMVTGKPETCSLMKWILNSMEELLLVFHYCKMATELWDSISTTYAYNKAML